MMTFKFTGFLCVFLFSSVFPASALEGDLNAWLVKAGSKDSAERKAAYTALSEGGRSARAKLAVFLDRRLRNVRSKLSQTLKAPQTQRIIAKETAVLQARRKAALDLIRSETAYPDGPPHSSPQERVDTIRKAVVEAWSGRRSRIYAALPALKSLVGEVDELGQALFPLERPQRGGFTTCFETDAMLTAAMEPEVYAARFDLAANRFEDTSQTFVERVVLRHINAYRLALNLPVLRFDERLYRAAAWYARYAHQHHLRGHICEVQGRRDPVERAQAEGHPRCVGECVGFNGSHLEDWLHSASHHRVLIEAKARQGAVAVFKNVAVLVTGLKVPSKEPAGAAQAKDTAALLESMGWATRMDRRSDNEKRLLRLAHFMKGKGDLASAVEALEQALIQNPKSDGAREALGQIEKKGRPVPKIGKAVPERKILQWQKVLKESDTQARIAVLRELVRYRVPNMRPIIEGLLAVDKGPLQLASLEVAARLGMEAGEQKALALLASEDPEARAAAAGALEWWGTREAVDGLIQGLEIRLAEYPFIRAIETITPHRTQMHFGDTRQQREAKLKALKEWWAEARKRWDLALTFED